MNGGVPNNGAMDHCCATVCPYQNGNATCVALKGASSWCNTIAGGFCMFASTSATSVSIGIFTTTIDRAVVQRNFLNKSFKVRSNTLDQNSNMHVLHSFENECFFFLFKIKFNK